MDIVNPFPGGPETGGSSGLVPLPGPLTVGDGRHQVRLVTIEQGRDLLVQIIGGEAHVGAVAVSYGPDRVISETGSDLMILPGHKEGPLALQAAQKLGAAAGCTVAVAAGIHQDDITAEEIAGIMQNVEKGVEALADLLARRRGA